MSLPYHESRLKRTTLPLALCCLLAPLQIKAASAASELYSYALAMYSDTKKAATGPLETQKEWSNDGGSMSASSTANFGVLRARSEAHAAAKGGWNVLGNGAQAYWVDTMTISAPGLENQQGTLTVKFRIDGSLMCSGGGDESRASYSTAEFELYRDEGFIQSRSQTLYYDGRQAYLADEQPSDQPFLGKEMTANMTFTFGKPFKVKLYIGTLTRAYQYLGAVAVADLSHTATWGGFASVRDSQGQQVPSYTAFSQTGVNYREPIGPPVPRLAVAQSIGNLHLSWHTNFSSMRLEGASTPAGPWSPVTNAPTLAGEKQLVTVPAHDTSRFYRLNGN